MLLQGGELGSVGGIFSFTVREQTGGCPSIKDFSFESSENVVTIEAALNKT